MRVNNKNLKTYPIIDIVLWVQQNLQFDFLSIENKIIPTGNLP